MSTTTPAAPLTPHTTAPRQLYTPRSAPPHPRGPRRVAYTAPVSYRQELGQRLLRDLVNSPAAISSVAASLVPEWTEHGADITDVILTSAAELADRTASYAAVVAVMCATGCDGMAESVLGGLSTQLTDACTAGNWRRTKLLMRFVGALSTVGIVADASQTVTQIYSAWMLAMQAPMAKLERRDTFAALILTTLPWCAAALGPVEADKLLASVVAYAADPCRGPRLDAAKACRALSDSAHFDSVSLMAEQVSHCSSCGWQTPLIVNYRDEFSQQISTLTPAMLPVTELVPADGVSLHYLPVQPHLSILADEIKPAHVRLEYKLPKVESIERFIMYDIVDDLVHAWENNIGEGAKYLMDTVLFPAITEDDGGPCSWSIAQVLIEALAANILRLPQSHLKRVFYTSFIVFLCLHARTQIPRVLGAVFYTLYTQLDRMDVECQCRFQAWFAHHISNFDYRWGWADWADALALPLHAPKSLFIQEVLEMGVRLSYFERVTKALPPGGTLDIISLMPPQPRPHFRYESRINRVHDADDDKIEDESVASAKVDPQLVKFADRVIEAMRLKQSAAEMKQHVLDIAQYADTTDGMAVEQATVPGLETAREVALQCILFIGSKSFSHTLNILERQSPLLHFLNSTADDKLQTVRAVARFWQYNKQMLVIVLDKMINYKIIDPSAVISWVFTSGSDVAFNRSYVWSLLKAVVTKLNTRIQLIAGKLAKAESRPPSEPATPTAVDAMEDDTATPRKPALPLYSPHAKLQDTLDGLKQEQKQTFIAVFQHFVTALKSCTAADRPWLEGMMREFGRHFHVEMQTFATTVEMMVFMDASVDAKIKEIFQHVRQLHS